MKITEKDREAARTIVNRVPLARKEGLFVGNVGPFGPTPEEMEGYIAEAIAAAYARGLEDAAKRAIETRSCTHDHAPGECEECHWVARIAAAIRKLGEDA